MTFFDKKTEVMKIELTPYGRYKLSIGRLKPHHYRFFDNNVVYDGNAIGITEDQNDADHRIRQETPLLKQNPNVSGVETGIRILETDDLSVQMHYSSSGTEIRFRQNDRQNKRDDHINQMIYNLGTIKYESDQSPSFQVDAFRGELSESTSKFYSSKNIQTSSIPQIDLKISYEAFIANTLVQVYSGDYDFEPIGPFNDGSRIVFKKQNPLLRITERNAFDEKENFHVTAYKVFEDGDELLYEKLNFKKQNKKIQSDLYVEGVQNEAITNLGVHDVPYFVDLLFDKEIAESDYCATIGDLKIRNIYLDNEIICPDLQETPPFNIYQSQVSPEDLEDCD
tara:strand:- start:1173 stop:2186 length:1014 start_codon:yes stop_codon:yes gene_type:complete